MGRTRWLPFAIVSLLAAAPYLATPGFDFVFDDRHLIVHNLFLREATSPFTAFAHHFWHGTPYGAAYYRPLVVASFALNGHVLGWGPAGFHLVNILLHAGNAMLLLALARRLGCPALAASCAAGLFAVHPVAAWPVASVVARVDLLPALFVSCAWLALCPSFAGTPLDASESRPDRGRRAAWVGFFLLALLSKESAVAFLVVPLLALRRMRGEANPVKPGPRVWAALAAALVGYLALRRAAGAALLMDRRLIDPLINPLGVLPFPARILAAADLSGRYMLYVLAPIRFGDPRNYLDAAALPSLSDAAVIGSLAVLLVWAAAVVVLWLRRDRISVPLGFALASFLPASNLIVPITSLYALNFLYMPLLGLSLAVGELLGRTSFLTSRHWRAQALGAGLLLAALAAGSFREAGIWRDEATLFAALEERFPSYAPAHSGLGVALLDRGRPGEAIAPLRKALAITDTSLEAHYNLGTALILTSSDRRGLEEALLHLRRAIELRPGFVPARIQAGRVLLLLDRPEEAAGQFRDLARQFPSSRDIRSRLVDSLIRTGDFGEARVEALSARQDFPEVAWFDFCLARVEAHNNRREALALLEAAIAKDASARAWIREVDDFNFYRGVPEFDRMMADR